MTNHAFADGPWRRISVPQSVSGVPSMLHYEEQQYLMWLTAQKYEGFGAVVDLGPWLGGSSVALAHGLRERALPGRVQSFDLFSWDTHYMQSSFATDLKAGDDFEPLFRKLTAAYADRIEARQMDLTQATWNGGPIEILFVDAAKSWALWRSILRVFGPHLVPGKSRVVHQDFRFPACAWLPLSCDSRPDVWQQTEATAEAWTVTFTPRRRLRAEDGDELVREDLPWASRKELLQRRIASDFPAVAWMYRLTLCGEALRHGDHELCAQLDSQMTDDRRRHPESASVADGTLPYSFLDAGWRACGKGRFKEALDLAARIPATSAVYPYALVLTGQAARSDQQLDRAEAALAEALALRPDLVSAQIEQMWLRLSQRRYAEGEAIGRRVLATFPDLDAQTKTWLLRAQSLLLAQQGKFDEALLDNERGEAMATDSFHRSIFLADRAQLFKTMGKPAEAAASAQRALQLHPDNDAARAILR